jgi:hypothetical protein
VHNGPFFGGDQVHHQLDALRAAILDCRQADVDNLVFHLTLHGHGNDVEQVLHSTVETAPHDVQMWWRGECNCDGHLN